MGRRGWGGILALALAASLVIAGAATGQGNGNGKLLVFTATDAAPNPATADAVELIEGIGADADLTVEVSDDPADIDSATLGDYRAVVFVHSAGDVLGAAQATALQDYVNGGGGFVGIGETAELQPGEAFFNTLIGARPAASGGQAGARDVEFGDRVHPATRDLPPLREGHNDAWYAWAQNPTGNVHTVARVRLGSIPQPGDLGGTPPSYVTEVNVLDAGASVTNDAVKDDGIGSNPNNNSNRPVSWCRDIEQGRSFYTALGRTPAAYASDELEGHFAGAIAWAAGTVRGNCKATINSNYTATRLTPPNAPGQHNMIGEAVDMDIADDGRVFYIGRARCAPGSPQNTNWSHPEVGLGCGTIHVWDPNTDGPDNQNPAKVTHVATLDVFGQKGGGAEVGATSKAEQGLTAIALDPEFTNGRPYVYVEYYPWHADEHGPGFHRPTFMAERRLSRFDYDNENDELVAGSERVIFHYMTQMYACCHTGGSMAFDSEGNIHIPGGDMVGNSPNGNMGGYQNAYHGYTLPAPGGGVCDLGQHGSNPTGCGAGVLSFGDARISSGNTATYEGAMLRIRPLANPGPTPKLAPSAPGTGEADAPWASLGPGQATLEEGPDGWGLGSTYALPDQDSPNGPNMYPLSSAEVEQGLARPEIYSIGLRNQYSVEVDPETDLITAGSVGPDQNSHDNTWGLEGHSAHTVMPEAGNYLGWPYCWGNGLGYRKKLPGVAPGIAAPVGTAGTIPGPPYSGGQPQGGWNDCRNPILNDSPFNEGLETIPAPKPVNFWWGRSNLGCPDYRRDQNLLPFNFVNQERFQRCPWAAKSPAGGSQAAMTGPIYRIPDGAGHSDGAWPEYWDGRWFLFNWGGHNTTRHAVLLPEDPDSSSPALAADSLVGIVTPGQFGGGTILGHEFGPDGALYLLHYGGGGFDITSATAIWRYAYAGGPDTPGADPQAEVTDVGEVAFSIGNSGGVAYEWDFGDGNDSQQPNPVHTYDELGSYDVALTVTYADGATDSKTIRVNVSDDVTPPVTTALLDGSEPGDDAYESPVEVELSATDGPDGIGVEATEWRVDGGAWQERTNDAEDDPFVSSFNVTGGGQHTVEFRSRDLAGNVEETKSVEFRIAGGACHPLSDDFGGDELAPKWDVINPNPGNPATVGGGHLTLPILTGDLYEDRDLPQNLLLQDVPQGTSWVATAKVAHDAVDNNGDMVGVGLVNNFNPNYFAKTGIIWKNEISGIWAERVLTTNGQAQTLPGDSVPWPNSGLLTPEGDYMWVRLVYDASADQYTTWVSTNGTQFTTFGASIPGSSFSQNDGALRIGLFAKRDSGTDREVDIDAFNFVAGTANPQTPGDHCGDGGGDACHPLSDGFDGSELDPGWEVLNLNPSAPPVVGNGHLTLPLLLGDMFGNDPIAQNLLLRDVPDDGESWVATAKIAHAGLSDDNDMASLALVNSIGPNYFAKTGLIWKNDIGGHWAERVLTVNGTAQILPGDDVAWPNSGLLNPPGDYVWVRFAYDAGADEYTTWTSVDGATFTSFGAAMPGSSFSQNDGALRIGLFAKLNQGSGRAADFDAFNFVSGTSDPQVPGDDCGAGEGDVIAPTTTHELEPADPDGERDWWVSPVTVTLEASDNEGGSGVAATEYRFEGEEEWTVYEGPFTISDSGQHRLQYRSRDNDGNVETTRSVLVRVDREPPETEALIDGAPPVNRYDGPVEVELSATDDASGVEATEVRIDGGDWQPYVSEQMIFDGTEETFADWTMAPTGSFQLNEAEGFMRTVGGLGMLWYSAREYGDYRLRFEFRDSRGGGADNRSNSGVFIRFPNPDEAVARPPAERYPCQIGSGQTQPAWMAIYCGQEIQINDHPTNDPQKTGSVYNFSPNDLAAGRPVPKGVWSEYEVRVEGGGDYEVTVTRDGEVIKEFQNTPGQEAARPGDPPTDLRQFATGYIGLQNHGGDEAIDFRDVRVLPLVDGAVQGPFTVEGEGQHTIEFRSTDAAGNEEQVRSVSFRIGEGGDVTPPVTTHELDPADPGAGGTYDGPVDVSLLATDPPEDAPDPTVHDVAAQPTTWEPDELAIDRGDIVRWSFPEETAGFGHDVWLLDPDSEPDGVGFEVTDGVVPPGGDPVSYAFADPGTWTFVCKEHSFVNEGAWQGMVGTVEVADGPGSGSGEEPSGVARTEYRVTTDGAEGELIESVNDGGDDPFATELTVSAPGSHEVAYRSVDNAGNEEEWKSVEFAIGPGGDDTTPPVTTHMLFPPMPGDGGVYDRTVGVTLSAIDPGPDASGVAATYHRVTHNGVAGDWELYNPFVEVEVEANGEYLVEYYSEDNAGNVEDPPGSVEFSIEREQLGEPELRVVGRPALRRVGPRKKQTQFRLQARNVGDAPSGPVRLCAGAPKKRVAVRGGRCSAVSGIAPQATRQRQVRLRIKPKARGKLTRIKLFANGPNVTRQETSVRLRVRR